MPCASEQILSALHLPVLFPRNPEELIEFGLYGVALSRLSGSWVSLKIVADVADGIWSHERDFGALQITAPEIEWNAKPWVYQQAGILLPPANLKAEEQLFGPRAEMVQAFARSNPLNRIEINPPHARIGIVAAGKTFDDVIQGLNDLGLHLKDVERAGVRVMRIGMITPLERDLLRTFASGLSEVLVVEEKAAFVETHVRDRLYGMADAPAVLGKRGRDGQPLVPASGELTAKLLAKSLRTFLTSHLSLPEQVRERELLPMLSLARTPYFCSGCPHNRSTVVPDGSLAAGGIGCHAMAALIARPESAVTGLTQMGGEGAQWIGQAAFCETPHIFQNVGDGTYFHSAQLAVQACIAAGVNITFKLLYNATVAMTGGQDATGVLDVAALTKKLTAEGVAKVLVVADDPSRYNRRSKLAPGVEVLPRERLDEAQRALRDIPGVTVLIYDQQCAAEARRLRKRGGLAQPTQRVVINEAVCEGCGDCGVKSNCLSVQPVETELGRKTRIDQGSCNSDYSCLEGDCPSFVTVEVAPSKTKSTRSKALPTVPASFPDPACAPLLEGRAFNILLAGVGGTGIVTVNQVLATAGMLEGVAVRGLDQTGLSQKAGPVTSHLRIGSDEAEPSNRAGVVDCYLALDLLVGADSRHVALASPERTHAFVSMSNTPTGNMVRDGSVSHPAMDELLQRLTASSQTVFTLDTLEASLRLLGNTMSANVMLLGAAFQSGHLPLSAESIERAISVNGVAVQANVAAFRWGRLAVADPTAFAAAGHSLAAARSTSSPRQERAARLVAASEITGETKRLAEFRAAELLGYQSAELARRYLDVVARAWAAELRAGTAHGFSEAVARGAHKLMAYKDEYEVARQLTCPDFAASLSEQFPGHTTLRYRLHPPVLRSMGLKHKIALGAGSRPMLRMMAAMRHVRGTPLDVFGYGSHRRLEREIAAEYLAMVTQLADQLTPSTYDTAVDAANAAELVRGYERIKERAIETYRARLKELGVLQR